jgi:hypothetical protein
MGVKRFDFIDGTEPWMEEATLGQYVKSADYDALAAELVEWRGLYEHGLEDRNELLEAKKQLEAALRDLLPYAEHLAGENYQCEVIKNARDLVTPSETKGDADG